MLTDEQAKEMYGIYDATREKIEKDTGVDIEKLFDSELRLILKNAEDIRDIAVAHDVRVALMIRESFTPDKLKRGVDRS